MSVRFAPRAAPTIAVTGASNPSAALKPSHAPTKAPPAAPVNPTVLTPAGQSRWTQATYIPRPIGTPTDSTTSSWLSIGTPVIVVVARRAPAKNPPRPSTSAHADRSRALVFRPNPA